MTVWASRSRTAQGGARVRNVLAPLRGRALTAPDLTTRNTERCRADFPLLRSCHCENRLVDAARFGDGSISLRWTDVDGIGGLQAHLVLKGTLNAKGHGIGSVVQISADVSAWDMASLHYALLGTTAPKAFVLNWVKQQWARPNPPPDDETTWEVELRLPMSPCLIEGLEASRQGGGFTMQMDTTILLVDRGEPLVAERTADHAGTHPTITGQDRMLISPHAWAQVLQRWERGVNVSVLVPLPAVEPNADRADVVRHLAAARQKIDGGDYQGTFTECRQALELLRKLSPASLPMPKVAHDRDPSQRVHVVLDSLYSFTSAALHTDESIKDFTPTRADAVAVIGATASLAQQIFAWLDRR